MKTASPKSITQKGVHPDLLTARESEHSLLFRKAKSTPDPDTFEKHRDTPPISIAILLQKYALLLAESSIYTTLVARAIRNAIRANRLKDSRESFAVETPIFIARLADSHESLEFPIRANHATKCTTNLYHDTAPVCIATLLQMY